ncbi:MAG: hypothetical protein KJZ87_15715, partial [Thermoguttaceae bacterium]|nr:hypothetical protein [Thermoguttaceae bacterium]
ENAPAAMDVHLVLPETVEFAQTDRYEPEPEPQAGDWSNTWHLSASTVEPAREAHYLAVLLPHRDGKRSALPRVELLRGKGAVGVKLIASDGAEDIVAFRTDAGAPTVSCGGLESSAQLFASGKNSAGTVTRSFSRDR